MGVHSTDKDIVPQGPKKSIEPSLVRIY